ncbi:Sepiapterin reductase [Camponotus floridanus]|uniref:Sepiapterin reductase n=1 Tax=Camponotus floridanus TaxID=104421 RepID=E2B0I2_CAMFO|nr:sepiapterin reductase [Camponotus floridanus]EFN60824.1 Sepiapterin reductase [Camponotus floridanus]
MSIEVLSGKVFLVITGASRGIGRQIAITFGPLLQEGSHILLLARNLNSLQEIAKNISSKVTVHTVSMDLGEVTKTDFEKTILGCLKETTRDAFDRVVVVHNVGTIGDVTKLTNEMLDIDYWKQYYTLNLFLPAVLNAVIMNLFDESTNTKKVVINITSLFAIQVNAACGYYCSVKAAREMFFKVFALENPDVNVLNYSPGPVDTDMFQIVCETVKNPETKKRLKHMQETNTVLTTEQTVKRLLKILKEQKYNAGDRIDYFDN